MVDNDRTRQNIIQITWEELGSGNPEMLHSKLFLAAASLSKNKEINWKKEILNSNLDCKILLDQLYSDLENCKTSYQILGMTLGMEIPANENIDCLFNSVCYDVSRETLENSSFFKIHRVNEDQHIAANIENFEIVCKTQKSKEEFIEGFTAAVTFWKFFWDEASSNLELNKCH
jgi:hypothetical protein